MIAVDTNILVRLVTRDDPHQAEIADRVMNGEVVVPVTVLLELAWVLRGKTYHFDRTTLAAALIGILDLSTVTIAEEERVRWALDRYSQDGDIADLIHIAVSRGSTAFVSFDEALASEAGASAPLTIRRPS